MRDSSPSEVTATQADDSPMVWVYLAVLVVEALVLVALWTFSKHFGL